jgi:hypothetical protein
LPLLSAAGASTGVGVGIAVTVGVTVAVTGTCGGNAADVGASDVGAGVVT